MFKKCTESTDDPEMHGREKQMRSQRYPLRLSARNERSHERHLDVHGDGGNICGTGQRCLGGDSSVPSCLVSFIK